LPTYDSVHVRRSARVGKGLPTYDSVHVRRSARVGKGLPTYDSVHARRSARVGKGLPTYGIGGTPLENTVIPAWMPESRAHGR